MLSCIIASTEKYLQSDWLRGVQYWTYLYSAFNISILEWEKNNIRFFYHNIEIIAKLPYHNVNNNQIFTKVTKQEVKKWKGFLQQHP